MKNTITFNQGLCVFIKTYRMHIQIFYLKIAPEGCRSGTLHNS